MFRNQLARFVREVTERDGEARAQTIRDFMTDEETTKPVFGELGDEVWPICESSIETRVLIQPSTKNTFFGSLLIEVFQRITWHAGGPVV